MNLPENNQRNIDLYNGYCKMPLLWKGKFESLEQFYVLEQNKAPQKIKFDFGNARLGKLAEKLFSIQIKNTKQWKIIFENLQIFEGKNTLGELDICLQNLTTCKYIHIELITKFYLYNPAYRCNSIKAWIGPNRNDSLAKKIEKLKNKQHPLLYNNFSKEALNRFNIPIHEITQKVHFKAWLFVPLHFKDTLTTFNTNCIGGLYMSFENFILYSKNFPLFYVPSKQNWLRLPETQKEWFSFSEILEKVKLFINANKAVLIWLKKGSNYKRIMITPYSEF